MEIFAKLSVWLKKEEEMQHEIKFLSGFETCYVGNLIKIEIYIYNILYNLIFIKYENKLFLRF